MKEEWQFVQNPFDNVTKENFLKMLKISTWHINALKAKAGDVYYDQLILDYEPLHLNYVDKYNKWDTSIGTHVGGTASFEELIRQLSEIKAEDWDIAIQVVYRRGSPQYLALLPHYRKDFQSGSNESRVNAVKNLSTAIGTDPALAVVKASVDAFLLLLNNARTAQQGDLSETSDFSTELETARVEAAEGQYRSLGSLMHKFYKTPKSIEPFFDLANIRKSEQTEFKGTVKAGKLKNIFKRTLEPADEISLINTGDAPLRFAMVAEKNDPVGEASLTVLPEEEEIVEASALGNVPESKYLKVKNDDAALNGKFKVVIL